MRLRVLTLPLFVLGIGAAFPGTLGGQRPAADWIIDISATDAAGAPFATLEAKDLVLRIDGRVNPILNLRSVRGGHEPSLVSPPYASNQVTPGRTVALASDVTRLKPGNAPQVRDSINAVLDTLAPRDRISVIALASDGFATDYTTRREIARAAATKLPTTATGLADPKALEASTVASLTLLEQLCTRLASEPSHKTLVLITAPFATSSRVRRAIQAVGAVTARQRLQLVLIDPTGADAPAGGLAALAAATGGTLLPVGPDLPQRFSGVAGRSAARYELQFTFTGKTKDDTPHRVQVASLRQDVQITAPPQLFVPKDGSTWDPLAALTDMLRQPRAWRDLPLRLAVFPVLDVERDRLRLLVLGEPEDQKVPLAWAEFALIAPSGAVVAEWKAEGADLATRPMMTAALAAPGAYRLRMAASELSGRRGAVDYEFDARLTPAGALAMGPLMFGGIANQAFQPLLQPAVDTTAVMAYAELYGRPAATDILAARFEIAATPDGPPLVTIPGSIRTTPADDRRAALGAIELTALPPGDYVVRAIVSLNGTELGRVTRTLRKAAQ